MSDEPLDLGPIKARYEAATEGPWAFDLDPFAESTSYKVIRRFGFFGPQIEGVAEGMAEEDAEFVTHSHQDVPALIAEVEALREGMHAYTEHASRWKRERDEARAIIERAHHESIAGDGRSSVVLAVVRDILAEGVAE